MRALAQKQNQPVRRASSILARPGVHLQRTVDRQAVQTTRFAHDFTRIPVHARAPIGMQPKLAVSAPGNAHEQEADRAAEHVTGVLPKQNHVPSNDFEQTAAPPIVHEVLRSSGHPLDPGTRALMEPRFGQDFTHVRLHTNARAAESAAAVNALAYTVGDDIVFGAGQHAPASSRGQQLLAHELAHVVQQSGGPASLFRQPAPDSDKLEAQKNADARNEAVKRHKEQQQHVVAYVDKARAIRPNPKKGLRDPDNLVRNTVGMLDSGKLTLTVLSPTHYSPATNFDVRVKHPAIGGDYPARPFALDAGIVTEHNTSSAGRIAPLPAAAAPAPAGAGTKDEPARGRVSPLTGEVEPAPVEPAPATAPAKPPAPIPFSPRDVWLFTRGLEITEADFRNTFVHEVQHLADLHLLKPNAEQDKLEGYKSEFRAFWIQPPIPRTGALGVEAIHSLPEATDKLDGGGKVSVPKPATCTICPAPDPSVAGGTSAYEKPEGVMKNPRQKAIFEYIMSRYPDQEYACCYIYNQQFHEGVEQFAYPESVNLINSDRLMDLNLVVRTLDRSKPLSTDSRAELVILLTRLEPLDWIFLKNRKVSTPFWDMLKTAAPGALYKAVNALVGKGIKKPVTEADVNRVLPGK